MPRAKTPKMTPLFDLDEIFPDNTPLTVLFRHLTPGDDPSRMIREFHRIGDHWVIPRPDAERLVWESIAIVQHAAVAAYDKIVNESAVVVNGVDIGPWIRGGARDALEVVQENEHELRAVYEWRIAGRRGEPGFQNKKSRAARAASSAYQCGFMHAAQTLAEGLELIEAGPLQRAANEVVSRYCAAVIEQLSDRWPIRPSRLAEPGIEAIKGWRLGILAMCEMIAQIRDRLDMLQEPQRFTRKRRRRRKPREADTKA